MVNDQPIPEEEEPDLSDEGLEEERIRDDPPDDPDAIVLPEDPAVQQNP